jgi:MFS transporter, DHA1 family, inner membrane transport protein
MSPHEATRFQTLYLTRRFAERGEGRRKRRDPAGPRGVAAILFLCLFAAQSGQLALTPVLTDAARVFAVSTASAGQIRTVAAVVAAAAALAVGAAVARVRLRTLLSVGIALLVTGAATSFAAPSLFVLAAGQALTGAASSTLVAAGVAAAAAWSGEVDRGRVVAWTLVGAPTAWVVAMPVIGVVGATNWRLAFVVPVVVAAVAAVALRRAPVAPPPRLGPGLRSVLADRTLRGWVMSEVFAYAAWSGVLVYCGALFVESYGSSPAVVGLSLGLGAAAYIPGTFLAQRIAVGHGRPLLVAMGLLLAVCVVTFGVVRVGTVPSAIGFGALCFLAGARTYLGSAVGLDLAAGKGAAAMSVRAAAAQIGWILGGGLGGASLAVGGYPALASVFAVLFVAGAVVHVPAFGAVTRRGRGRATHPQRLPLEAAAPARVL